MSAKAYSENTTERSGIADYARRILIAANLAKLGCKWPALQELLGIKTSDAQRLVHDLQQGKYTFARVERGMHWFRINGSHNVRMLHATFLYSIFTQYKSSQPELHIGEILICAYKLYHLLTPNPVLDNINRAYYLLSALERNRGFLQQACTHCNKHYVSIGALEGSLCPACDRYQYIECHDCHSVIADPYAPGRNGNKKIRCPECALRARRLRRQAERKRKLSCMPTYHLH